MSKSGDRSGPVHAWEDGSRTPRGGGCVVVLVLPLAALVGLVVTAHEAGWV